ncbi:MAG: hypothetical protein KGO02_21085 [Alphaproteobacteria bacterium]|nr:hypothetical protein [Alphaproteobacteria bacterium]
MTYVFLFRALTHVDHEHRRVQAERDHQCVTLGAILCFVLTSATAHPSYSGR